MERKAQEGKRKELRRKYLKGKTKKFGRTEDKKVIKKEVMKESTKIREPLSDASASKGERQHVDPQRNINPVVDKKKRVRPVGGMETP